ncbi:PAS domain S-box protein [Burkholderiaceae bacterium DAT-1]|nr:PAS domain S-box protein [Burkholderiaceae bacterium DAT-1]
MNIALVLICVLIILLASTLFAMHIHYRLRRRIEADLDHLPLALLTIDRASGHLRSCNQVASAMLELAPDSNLFELFGSDFQEAAREIQTPHTELAIETLINLPSGKTVEVSLQAKIQPSNVRHLMVMIEDISQQKMDRQALLDAWMDSEELYNNASAAYFSLDRSGAFIRINATGSRWLGYRRDQLVGKMTVHDLLTKDSEFRFATGFAALEALGVINNLELAFTRQDGSILPTLSSASALYDDDGNFMCSRFTLVDLTERQRAEQLLAEHHRDIERMVLERTAELHMSEQRAGTIIRNMRDGVVHYDESGRILSGNSALARMFGFDEDSMVGMDIRKLLPISLGDTSVHQPTEHAHLHHREMEARHADGHLFVIEFAADDLFDDNGISHIGVVHDITSHKEIEREHQRARQEAERLARAKSDFLANMSHEIRTPLNGVLGLARISVRENQGRNSLDTSINILKSAEHLLGIVNDILDFSRIEAGKLHIDEHPFAMPAFLDHLRGIVAERADAKGLSLVITQADDVPEWVCGDSMRLTQIVSNLLSNAVKFTEQGKVCLNVSRVSDQISFAVCDTGIGIRDDLLIRLFQPFEQGDSSTTRNYGGSGLGLAICRRLADLMHGEIKVRSTLGEGSCFTLTLPLPAANPISRLGETGEEDAIHNSLSGVSVLAADDVEVNRMILADILSRQGAQLTLVENGLEAVNAVRQAHTHFDVVLMDVQMPVMDGHTATREILASHPSLPIIGLTAHALAEERERCLASGMAAHVTKPVDEVLLIRTMIALLQGKEDIAQTIEAQPCSEANREHATCSGLIDWSVVESRFRNNVAFVKKLARTALDSHQDTPEKLNAARASQDWETLGFLVHKIKGLAGNLVAESLFQLAITTEDFIRQQQFEEAARILPDVVAHFSTLLSELTQYIADESVPTMSAAIS